MRPRHKLNIERLETRELAAAGLVLRLTTDHPIYRPGQAVVITLTEKNTSKHAIQVAGGPSLGSFRVSQAGRELWRSDSGFQPEYNFEKTLRPGESFSQRATWHGETPEGTAAHRFGPFTIRNAADPGAKVVIRFVPAPTDAGLNQRTHPLGGRISR